MRILLDECLDRKLARVLTGHYVRTVPQMGWAGIKNGRLVALAEQHFDVFVTVDRKLPTEQDLKPLGIAVVVLEAVSNRLADTLPLVPRLLASIPIAKPGAAFVIRAAP